ncbi:hypothetical protein Pint_10251 [Pistacia integerrima]|uniref:Uncharacterized protein n=1 Tax=Pistacia integerrima TaxID=434235 RepID=A0ACC0XHM2_9ROSI|nr:hypothetical protein Pint_10251 [Pistacia integerrima]
MESIRVISFLLYPLLSLGRTCC